MVCFAILVRLTFRLASLIIEAIWSDTEFRCQEWHGGMTKIMIVNYTILVH